MLQSAEHDQQPVQGYQRVGKSSESTGIKTGWRFQGRGFVGSDNKRLNTQLELSRPTRQTVVNDRYS